MAPPVKRYTQRAPVPLGYTLCRWKYESRGGEKLLYFYKRSSMFTRQGLLMY